MHSFIKQVILSFSAFAVVFSSGCTPEGILGTCMALAIVDSMSESNVDNDRGKDKKQINSKPKTFKKIVRKKRPDPKPSRPSASDSIINAYKSLEWQKCLRLAAEQVNSPNTSHNDQCTGRILAGAIHYQSGNTDAAEKYFISNCKIQDSPVFNLLSPKIIIFYKKCNSR
jgi:hypothetical protein